jgi:hypothetical protein
VSFAEVLSALQSMLGDRVEAAIESPAGGMVAHLAGRLAQGHDLSPRQDTLAAPVFVSFAEDGASAFFVDPRTFADAEWSSDGEVLRIEDCTGVTILIESGVTPRAK